MLQTRALARPLRRTHMMDASNQQAAPKQFTPGMQNDLARAAARCANFKNMTPLPAMAEASASVDEKHQRYQAALTELYSVLDNGSMDAYFAQPARECKTRWARSWW